MLFIERDLSVKQKQCTNVQVLLQSQELSFDSLSAAIMYFFSVPMHFFADRFCDDACSIFVIYFHVKVKFNCYCSTLVGLKTLLCIDFKLYTKTNRNIL